MKRSKLLLIAMVCLLMVVQLHAQTKLGGTVTTINPGATLELGSTNQGLLLNKVSIANTTTWCLLGTATAGMQVYNTNTSIAAGNATYPILTGGTGIYFWDGTGWVGVSPVSATSGKFWSLLGNAGTVDGTNFLGTTDNIPLNFRINNITAGRIDPINSFYGYRSGGSTTGPGQNSAFGSFAMQNNTNGFNNAAFGYFAMQFNTTGLANTAVGTGALNDNTTGNSNVAIGSGALQNGTAINENVAVGWGAGMGIMGNQNIFIGNGAGTGNNAPNGNNNMYIGYQAGVNVNTNGNNDEFIGYKAGATNTTGTNNTLIGYQSDVASGTLTNAAAIGYQAVAGQSNSMILGGTGANAVNIGVGTSTPNTSASIELGATNEGLLLNRVSLTNTTTWGLVGATTAAGMQVYNTNASITSSNTSYPVLTGGKGIYFWDGTGWVGVSPVSAISGQFWSLLGNAGTTPATNFMGTTDNKDVVFKRNNTQSGLLNSSNTSWGVSALNPSSTGTNNAAFGISALSANTNGAFNSAFGAGALSANTTGIDNTAMGLLALSSNISGGKNTAIGMQALSSNTSNWNVAVGYETLQNNTSADSVTAIGSQALFMNTTGRSNTAAGFQSLYRNTTGVYNTGVGFWSLVNNTTGRHNTGVGYQAFSNIAGGNDNTGIGYLAGANAIGGNDNIAIGSYTDLPSVSGSNQMNIGNTIFGTGMTGTGAAPAGNIGIDTNTPTSTLQIAGSVSKPFRVVTGNTTLTSQDHTVALTVQGNFTFTLPDPTTCPGRIYRVINYQDDGNGGFPIIFSRAVFVGDGNGNMVSTTNMYTLVDAAYSGTKGVMDSLTIQSDGNNWYAVGL